MPLFGKLLPAASVLIAAAVSVGAQAAPKPGCDATATKGALAKASFSVEQARTSQGTPGAPTVLTSAVKQLEAVKGEDPTVHALLMGQTLAFWLSQPGMSPTPRRGTLGFVQNPEATIDLPSTIDSLFRVVETAKPNCVELTTAYRGGLPGFVSLVNGAITALNADQLDSAEAFAGAASRLFPRSPYGSMVLGSVASKRKNDAKAMEYWNTSVEAASRDTIYRDVERQVLANQGSVYLASANTATGADRTAAARRAIDVYTKLLAVPGTTGVYASTGRSNLQSAQLLVGDTAAFVASYQPLMANPAAYSAPDLLNSGVNAARANRAADAARMFEATLQQNPYSRDGLFNLAVVYLTLEQNDKVGPIVERLIALDPANSENYNLAARAHLARAKSAQAAKKTSLAALYNDSTMTWLNRGARLPVEVHINEFNASDKQVVVGGLVTDRRDKLVATATETARPANGAKGAKGAKPKAAAAPATPALTAAPVTVKVEVLDKAGTVLGTQTVTTNPLTPGGSAPFRTTIQAADAVAYRYTIVGG